MTLEDKENCDEGDMPISNTHYFVNLAYNKKSDKNQMEISFDYAAI
jgi:hypothetical protein